MFEEHHSIMKNDVWNVVLRLEGKLVVTSKMTYKIKHAVDGSIENYKARFLARGFSQKEGIYYEENFAHVARYTLVRSITAIIAKMGWKLHQMDMKIVFLNGVVEDEVYMEQPLGFKTHDRKTHVCILKKALYGLNETPKTLYNKIGSFLMSLEFIKRKVDSNLYYKVVDGEQVIFLLYVDDMFLT